MKHISVAVDGPSGAGKSTMAKMAAARLGLHYLDTGAIYRTVGLAACRAGLRPDDTDGVTALLPGLTIALSFPEDGRQHMLLCGEDVTDLIRTPEIAKYASGVSAIPAVRAFLLDLQRDCAEKESIIMDGRDIGTVVLPQADVKIFLTASAEERARRRCRELQEKGQNAVYDEILADMRARDAADCSRAVSPLKQADDAVLLDTSDLDLQSSVEAMLEIIQRRCGL